MTRLRVNSVVAEAGSSMATVAQRLIRRLPTTTERDTVPLFELHSIGTRHRNTSGYPQRPIVDSRNCLRKERFDIGRIDPVRERTGRTPLDHRDGLRAKGRIGGMWNQIPDVRCT